MNNKPAAPTPPAETGFASPPCYAAEFPGHFGEVSEVPDAAAELTARLNALLEAERAGARVLAVLRDSLDSRSPLRGLLDQVQRDEGSNAVVLYKTIRRLGGEASHETGAFFQKTLAIDGLTERLRFVNKGQAWVVRKIDEVLPIIDDDAARVVLEKMRRSHLDNIAACDALLAEEG